MSNGLVSVGETVGVDVDHRGDREGIAMVEGMLHVESNLMTGPDGQIRVDANGGSDPQGVALPSHT